jgi:hypothetical protein
MADEFIMVATAVTSTNTVTVLSPGAAAVALVRSLTLHNNHTANTAAITVVVTDINTATEYVIEAFTQVTCKQTIHVLSQPLVVGQSDTLRIKADPVDDVHVVTSYLRIS